ncbi:ABC transporter permease [Aeromicrobium alkaliterrae]|uniref:Transport permease protein n=1 Tax=Aeromicrobium alkaliterrae TaxID=302168 RepID=A0ABP4VN27_9ACTN
MAAPVAPALRPHRPGPRAGALLLRAELCSVARDTAGLVLPLLMPTLILVMYGMQAADQPVDGTDLSYLEAFGVPMAIAMVLSLIGVVNMPSFLAAYRHAGVLRRLGVTPLRPSAVLVAQVVASAIQSVVGIALALGVAVWAFDVALPGSLWWALLVLLLGAAGLYGLGMIVAAVAPTPNASVAIGMVTFFAIGAVGGMFGPVSTFPDTVATIGGWLPFGAVTEALRAAWAGAVPEPRHLLALAVVALAGLLVAVRTFRWS